MYGGLSENGDFAHDQTGTVSMMEEICLVCSVVFFPPFVRIFVVVHSSEMKMTMMSSFRVVKRVFAMSMLMTDASSLYPDYSVTYWTGHCRGLNSIGGTV